MELNQPSGDSDSGPDGSARRWFRRESVSLAEIAVQTFSVVLGILLALGIDDWKREREMRQNVDDALHAVHTEIEANRAALQHHRDHLRAVETSVAKDAAPANLRPCNEYEGWNGTGTATLLNAAYQTAIATQAFAHMDFKRAQTIAAAYNLQSVYLGYLDKILDVVLRGTPMPPADCAGMIHELGSFADALDGEYQKVAEPPATPAKP